jgi:lipopolysaccharide cholinephosphotransferase
MEKNIVYKIEEASRLDSNIHKMTEEEMLKMKKVLLSILFDFINICEENNLIYFLGGGSCLGAVRHKGFIPWDDDLDVNMPRADYNKLISIIKSKEYLSGYDFTFPDKDKDTKTLFLKIYKNGTTNVEVYDSESPFPHGIFLDVFPMDNVPPNMLIRSTKGKICFFLHKICLYSFFSTYPSKMYRNMMMQTKETWFRYNLYMIIGSFVSFFISHRILSYFTDYFFSYPNISKYVTYPTGKRYYSGEMLPRNVFLPVSQGVFEGIKVNLPHNADAYLRNLYGDDYMSLPPLEKRESHHVVNLNFGNFKF